MGMVDADLCFASRIPSLISDDCCYNSAWRRALYSVVDGKNCFFFRGMDRVVSHENILITDLKQWCQKFIAAADRHDCLALTHMARRPHPLAELRSIGCNSGLLDAIASTIRCLL
jgi:hypothetical protein